MRKLKLVSFAELGCAELGWGHPKLLLITYGLEVDDPRDGLREGNA